MQTILGQLKWVVVLTLAGTVVMSGCAKPVGSVPSSANQPADDNSGDLQTAKQSDGDALSPRVSLFVEEAKTRHDYWAAIQMNEKLVLKNDDIPTALAYIKQHPDYTSYYLLRAIRESFRPNYKDIAVDDKAAILCSTLKTCRALNDWGHLDNGYDGEAAMALLGTGKVAVKYLAPLLDDDAPALWWGPKMPRQAAFISIGAKTSPTDISC